MSSSLVTPSSRTHLADRELLRGVNSSPPAAPDTTLFLPGVLPCCLRPEPGPVRGLNIAAVINGSTVD